MDRAVFLRSLPYLRQLPPSLWKFDVDAELTSSRSRTKSPTPSGHIDSVLLDNVLVSIDPSNASTKKRDRYDDQPVFFHREPAITEFVETIDTKNKNKLNGHHDNDLINNDPSVCSFEIAIVKTKYIAKQREALVTTNKNRPKDLEDEEEYDPNANVLLFRFGKYFVFEVNASSLVSIQHNHRKKNQDGEETEDGNEPLSKRQRTKDGEVGMYEQIERPESLCIQFPSCTFRVFSMEKNDSLNRAKNIDLASVRSKILLLFDVDSRFSVWGSCTIDKRIEREYWKVCLDTKYTEKGSPTKTDSSSTHFENGQKPSPDVAANVVANEKNNDQHEKEMSSFDVHSVHEKSNGESTIKKSESEQVQRYKTALDGGSSSQNLSDKTSLLDEISVKRRIFDESWSLVQKSISTNANPSHLTTCGQSLAYSYCSTNQHALFAKRCDAEIENATSNMQDLIERMMPTRGRVADDRLHSKSKENMIEVDLDQCINTLLCSRKNTIAAKYALFLVPKR